MHSEPAQEREEMRIYSRVGSLCIGIGALCVVVSLAGLCSPALGFVGAQLCSSDGSLSHSTVQTLAGVPWIVLWWGVSLGVVGASFYARDHSLLSRPFLSLHRIVVPLICFISVVFCVLPFFHEILPFLDLSTHLYHYHVAQKVRLHDPFFTEAFSYRFYPVPYLLSEMVIPRFGSGEALLLGARVFLIVGVIALPLSGWYYLRTIGSGNWIAIPLVALFSLNLYVLMGNLNYLMSISILMVCIGSFHRLLMGDRRKRVYVQAIALSTLLYFTHLFSFLVGLLYCGTLAMRVPRHKRNPQLLLIAFCPGLLLFAALLVRGLGGSGGIVWYSSLGEKLGGLLRFMWWTDHLKERILLLFPLCIVIALIGYGIQFRVRKKDWTLMVPFCVLLLAFLGSPKFIGATGFPDQRLLPVLLILGLGLLPPRKSNWLTVSLASIFLVATMVWSLHVNAQVRAWNQVLRPVVNRVMELPKNRRVLFYSGTGHPMYERFGHYCGRLRDWIVPGIFNDPLYNLSSRVVLPNISSLADVDEIIGTFYDMVIILGDTGEVPDRSGLPKWYEEKHRGRIRGYREFHKVDSSSMGDRAAMGHYHE